MSGTAQTASKPNGKPASPAPASQSDKAMAGFYRDLDTAIAKEKVGRLALFDFASTRIREAGKIKEFPLADLDKVIEHWHREDHKVNGTGEYKALKASSLVQYRKQWKRYYEIGECKTALQNVDVVRGFLETTKGRVWGMANKVMSRALTAAKAGKVITREQCEKALAGEEKDLAGLYRDFAKAMRTKVKAERKAATDADLDAFAETLLVKMEACATEAERLAGPAPTKA